MTNVKDDANPGGGLPCVVRKRVLCPRCGSSRIKVHGVKPVETDGSQLRYVRCQSCSKSFKLIEELPELK